MPNNIMLTFQKKKLCAAENVYAVKQSGGNNIQLADMGDKITFKRGGPDANSGLKIVFHSLDDPALPVPGPFVPPAGQRECTWTVDKSGHFKYDVEFPDTPPVEPLDPIIIINPRAQLSPSPIITLSNAVIFGVGIVVGMLISQFFF